MANLNRGAAKGLCLLCGRAIVLVQDELTKPTLVTGNGALSAMETKSSGVASEFLGPQA